VSVLEGAGFCADDAERYAVPTVNAALALYQRGLRCLADATELLQEPTVQPPSMLAAAVQAQIGQATALLAAAGAAAVIAAQSIPLRVVGGS
jgi:hypothetical protein